MKEKSFMILLTRKEMSAQTKPKKWMIISGDPLLNVTYFSGNSFLILWNIQVFTNYRFKGNWGQIFYRKENENRKANLDEVNKWIRDENEKRMAEAEALRAKLEREKQELRDFLEQGRVYNITM